MIKTYSQRMLHPYYGQAQIAETDRARAVSVDGETWEIHFFHTFTDADQVNSRKYVRVAHVFHSNLKNINDESITDHSQVDDRILELTKYLETVTLPFDAQDCFEYWLLDKQSEAPLALIFSCNDEDQIETFPKLTEWTALPSAVMKIALSEDEEKRKDTPVNRRLEKLVAERAGDLYAKARWFNRKDTHTEHFPNLLVTEEWDDKEHYQLSQRYIERQSTRLLMLHGLSTEDRTRLEIAAKNHATEVQRFHHLYPEVIDQKLMNAILVEARLRKTTEAPDPMLKRRDGIHYI